MVETVEYSYIGHAFKKTLSQSALIVSLYVVPVFISHAQNVQNEQTHCSQHDLPHWWERKHICTLCADVFIVYNCMSMLQPDNKPVGCLHVT